MVYGSGLTGTVDGKIDVIRTGDAVWCPPGVKHWHGASPETAMTHIALTGMKDGSNVEWMEEVSDEQYRRGAEAAKGVKQPQSHLQHNLYTACI